jgi:hypothetical protein
MNSERFADLPGSELVIAGLDDLVRGTLDSAEALLVAIGAPRLRILGIELPYSFPELPEHELYFLLSKRHGVEAHSKYKALVRRLVSFERALDGRLRREAAGV